jgi:hypothetical protein
MAKGRPKKRARATYNISGLISQSKHSSAFSESTPQPTPPQSEADGEESDLEEDDEDLDSLIHFDSLKTNLENEEAYPDDEEELEDEELEEWEGFSRGDLAEAMVDMLEAEDTFDLDWLPEKLKNRREKRKKDKKGTHWYNFRIFHLSCNQRDPRHTKKDRMSCPNQSAHRGGTQK